MKLVLNTEGITEDFFTDTRLVGIVASVKNYRFCWQVNNGLGYNFRLKVDKEIQVLKKGRNYFFPVYEHKIKNSFTEHFIYHNHFDGEYLLPEFKHIDFLWLIKGDGAYDGQCNEIINAVKNINGVQLVAELTNEKIKNKGNLIL